MAIYLVEDNESDATLLTDTLASAGMVVEQFVSGQDFALFLDASTTERKGKEILILDLHLPEQDGIEVLRLLHERDEKMPIILITAYDDKILKIAERLGHAWGLNLFAVRRKPLQIDSFPELVFSALADS